MVGSHPSRVHRFIPFCRFNQYTPSRYRSYFQFCCMRVFPWSRDSLTARAADFMCILFYCSTKVTPYKGDNNLPSGHHLSLPHWASPHRSRWNKNTKTRQIILVPHFRFGSVSCDCCTLHHFPLRSSRCPGTLLNWIAKSEFFPSFDLWPSYPSIQNSLLR
jgi:hypothetical protein